MALFLIATAPPFQTKESQAGFSAACICGKYQTPGYPGPDAAVAAIVDHRRIDHQVARMWIVKELGAARYSWLFHVAT